MTKTISLQDQFLIAARRDRVPVTIYMQSGFSLKGIVRAFDSFTVYLECEGRQHLVYKHAITSIVPSRVLSLPETVMSAETAE